jgi:hypothetical protein
MFHKLTSPIALAFLTGYPTPPCECLSHGIRGGRPWVRSATLAAGDCTSPTVVLSVTAPAASGDPRTASLPTDAGRLSTTFSTPLGFCGPSRGGSFRGVRVGGVVRQVGSRSRQRSTIVLEPTVVQGDRHRRDTVTGSEGSPPNDQAGYVRLGPSRR